MRTRLPLILALILAGWLLPAMAGQDTYRIAYDAGFADGKVAGSQDRAAGRPFDFANNTAYHEGLRGYDPQLHVRDVYQVAYRRGFEDGYEEGYGLGPEPRITNRPSSAATRANQSASVGGRVTISKDSTIDVRLQQTLATQRNEVGDDFRAEVIEDVVIDNLTVVPAGSRVYGEITHLKRAGRVRGRAEMTLHFQEIELADGSRIPIDGSVISIEPRRKEEVADDSGKLEAPGQKGEDAKKVGVSTGIGALIGVLTGGGGGAKVGGAIGALAGVAGVLTSRGNDLTLPTETELTIRLNRDATASIGMLRTH